MAAPAETRTPNLHRARNAHIECGWKGGVSLSSARKTGSGCERRTTFCFSLARQDSIRPAAAAVKALRYAPTAVAARPKRAVLTAVLAGQNHATIRAREKQKVMNDPNHLTSTGLLMEVLKNAHPAGNQAPARDAGIPDAGRLFRIDAAKFLQVVF